MGAATAVEHQSLVGFTLRVLVVVAVGLLVLLLVLWAQLLLIVFAAVLIAVLLRALAEPIERHTPLDSGGALAIAAVSVLAVLAGTGLLFGYQITSQLDQLSDVLPTALATLQSQIARLPFGDEIVADLDSLEEGGVVRVLRGAVGGLAPMMGSALSGAAHLLVVIFAGLFFASRPRLYRHGALALLPEGARARVRVGEAANASAEALRRWLLGQLVSMVLVGLLTWAGASIIGLPAPAALGLVAGLLEFVPIVGPIAAAVPGLLLALVVGPEALLWTLLFYVAIQQLEGNVITPLIQRRAVDLPPALTLFSVLGFGIAFGALGVVLATPLAVFAFVSIKLLWVRQALGRPIEVPGESG